MNYLLSILTLLAKLAAPVAAFFWAKHEERVKQLERENNSYENREKVENELVELTPSERRKLLRDKWGKRDETNPPNGRRYEGDF